VAGKRIAVEVLIDLRRRLDQLPARSRERRDIMHQAATLYGVSESTFYRQLEKIEALAKSLVLGESEDGKHKELASLKENETSLPSSLSKTPIPFTRSISPTGSRPDWRSPNIWVSHWRC
jgi:hypothetical protein